MGSVRFYLSSIFYALEAPPPLADQKTVRTFCIVTDCVSKLCIPFWFLLLKLMGVGWGSVEISLDGGFPLLHGIKSGVFSPFVSFQRISPFS